MTGGKFKLPKGYRELLAAAQRELDGTGISVEMEVVGKHPKLHFTDEQTTETLPFASTPRVNKQAEYGKRMARTIKRRFGYDA